jgi:hypothetical protein
MVKKNTFSVLQRKSFIAAPIFLSILSIIEGAYYDLDDLLNNYLSLVFDYVGGAEFFFKPFFWQLLGLLLFQIY